MECQVFRPVRLIPWYLGGYILCCIVLFVFLWSTTNTYVVSILFRTYSCVHRVLFAVSARSFVMILFMGSSLGFLSLLLKRCLFLLEFIFLYRFYLICDLTETINLSHYLSFFFQWRWKCSSFWSFLFWCFLFCHFFCLLCFCCCCCFIMCMVSLRWSDFQLIFLVSSNIFLNNILELALVRSILQINLCLWVFSSCCS